MDKGRQCRRLDAEALTEEQEARLLATRIRQRIGMLNEARMKRAARCDRDGFEEHARWFVGRVPSGNEIATRRRLKASDVEAWLPVEQRRTPPKRGNSAKVVEKAFWPGYVFIRLVPGADAWAGAILAGELLGWVSDGVYPVAISNMVVGELQRCEKAGDFEREAKLIGIPVRGDRVEVKDGLLAGMPGIVERFNEARQEVSLLVNLLGGQVAATMRLDDVVICR